MVLQVCKVLSLFVLLTHVSFLFNVTVVVVAVAPATLPDRGKKTSIRSERKYQQPSAPAITVAVSSDGSFTSRLEAAPRSNDDAGLNGASFLERTASRLEPLEVKAEGDVPTFSEVETPALKDRLESMPWDIKPYVSCAGHTNEARSTEPRTSVSHLGQALDHFCSLDKAVADLVELYPDPAFQVAEKRYRNGDTQWLQEAFVTYIGISDPEKYIGAEMDLLLQSVHRFSSRPIVVANFGTRLPSSWTPERFPRMILVHGRPMLEGQTFNFNKLRAMLFAKIETGMVLDADQFANRGIDVMFSRTNQEIGETYAYPIMPVHWMSRDPIGGDYQVYDFFFKSGAAPNRTMRWGHAHPTFTHHALPFVAKWLTRALRPVATGAPQWLRDQGYVEDEDLLNMALWSEGASKQWCKFDVASPDEFATYTRQDESMNLVFSDAKYFPEGIPIAFFTAHAAKTPRRSADILKELWSDTSPKKLITYKGRWFESGEALRQFDPGLRCIL